jgi:hypothetical protein
VASRGDSSLGGANMGLEGLIGLGGAIGGSLCFLRCLGKK